MGLDTRAFRRADGDWRQAWVKRTNDAGERPRFYGMLVEPLAHPLEHADAPLYHQDDLDELPWPGGLVGGMISGNCDGPSFRGKVYAAYVERVADCDLYGEQLEGDELKRVAEALRDAVHDPAPEPWPRDRDEREALARWFEVCVEHDLVVGGDF